MKRDTSLARAGSAASGRASPLAHIQVSECGLAEQRRQVGGLSHSVETYGRYKSTARASSLLTVRRENIGCLGMEI